MIRKFTLQDLDSVMELWLQTNIETHHFVERSYWENNFESVKAMMPEAELYVYETDCRIAGFIGLTEDYIAGIFVASEYQSQGIGKLLLDFVKKEHDRLHLHVYEKNTRAVDFYIREGFEIVEKGVDTETGEVDVEMGWTNGNS